MNTKVQKKSKSTSISVLTMLDQENIRLSFIEILKDYIIFFRIEDAMFHLHNVYAPYLKEGLDWEADSRFSGYVSIFKILNIHNEDELCSMLGDLIFHTISDNPDEAGKLAEKVFILWEHEIKKYFSTKNQ